MQCFLRENLRQDKLKTVLHRVMGGDGRTTPLLIELLILGGLLFLQHSQYGWQMMIWLSVLPANLLGVYTSLLTGFLSSLLQITLFLFFVRIIRRMRAENLAIKLYLSLALLRVAMFLLPPLWLFLPIAVRASWQFILVYPLQLVQSFLIIFFQLLIIVLHSHLLHPILEGLFLIGFFGYFFGDVIVVLVHLLGGNGRRVEPQKLSEQEKAGIAYEAWKEQSRKIEKERSRHRK